MSLNDSLTSTILQVLWTGWALCWLAASLHNKKAAVKESISSRIRYRIFIALGVALMFSGPGDDIERSSNLFPRGPVPDGLAVVLVGVGLGWALYARYHLGRNWSGTVQLKEGHSLVRKGPYRYSRHPIYTGLLLALVGLGLFLDNWLEIPGILLAGLGFRIKLAREERFMNDAFGFAYGQYRREVKMLVPFLW